MPTSPRRPIFWFSCCAVFLYFALSLAALGTRMFADTDPLWHIAAGDAIRSARAIPAHDPWSFTAGEYRWLNISWAWDALFSYAREHLGWHGPVALNALSIALTAALVFAHCLARSGSFAASFLALIGAMTLFSLHLRPLQITNLMAALWLLLLGAAARGHLRPGWLALLPASMLLWVNSHGGFIIGFAFLGVFFLQALAERRRSLARALFLTGAATLAAALCNPYGTDMVEAVRRPLGTVANRFIHEWEPFTASPGNLLSGFYLVAFLPLTLRRALPALAAEWALAYLWFFFALTSNRHLTVFAIASAPLVACGIQSLLARLPSVPAARAIAAVLLQCYDRRFLAAIAALSCFAAALWLPSPMAAGFYRQKAMLMDNLDAEIAFIREHHPKARLLTHFDLGGIVLYQTRGEIPVFVDPRTETAYPAQVLEDYIRFVDAAPGWEEMLDRYRLDGVLLPSSHPADKSYDALLDRFRRREGWEQAFAGPRAMIFMRTRHSREGRNPLGDGANQSE